MSVGEPNDLSEADAPASDDYSVMVLLVDDQMMVGEAVRRLLANQPNMDFHYCPDPAKAILAAKEVKPTVILQDLVMPGVDGLDLVRQYRADPITKDVPIIVLSTKEEAAIKGAAFTAGANDYLVKLPDKIELIARIRYHSRGYLNQLQRDDAYRALRESQRQLMETNFELQRLTNVDGLTELSNRRYFDEYMDAEWKRAVRMQTWLSVLMIDVDHFKQYNDTYGHLAGDDALRKVADTMQNNAARATDLVARYGGEEFAMILPATDLEGARHMGERLCESIEALHVPHSASSVGEFLTVSIGGGAMVPLRDQGFFVLVDTADKALYEAKKAGRNRVVARERDSTAPSRGGG